MGHARHTENMDSARHAYLARHKPVVAKREETLDCSRIVMVARAWQENDTTPGSNVDTPIAGDVCGLVT